MTFRHRLRYWVADKLADLAILCVDMAERLDPPTIRIGDAMRSVTIAGVTQAELIAYQRHAAISAQNN